MMPNMAERAGSTVIEIENGHMLPMTSPDEVAEVIAQAALARHLRKSTARGSSLRSPGICSPRSTPRSLGKKLGVSRDTVWRWRMIIFPQVKAVAPTVLSGIIETDDTAQCESRKGSREWVNSMRDPSLPKPPRLRWYEYPKRRPPQAIAKAFEEPILGVVDRVGHKSFQHIASKKQPSIDAALMPQVARDAMVLFDGAPQYEAIAKARGLSYHVLIGGRRRRRTPKAFHLNTVNSLHADWDKFIPLWRGPATKYLDGYARWMVARRDTDPARLFRSIISY